jgi:hypothetical protein
LIHENPHERYTSDQVESHPWISRKFEEEIPMTSSEKMKAFVFAQSFTRIIKAMYIVQQFSNNDQKLEDSYEQRVYF